MPQPRKYNSAAARQASYRQRCESARLRQLAEKGLPALPAVPTIPGRVRWRQAISAAHALLTQVAQEMSDYYDERSDTWQEGPQGEEFHEQLEAVCDVQEQVGNLLTA